MATKNQQDYNQDYNNDNDFISQKGNNRENVYYGVGNFLLEVIKVVALAAVIIFPIRIFLFQPFFVQGASMEPNFSNGQYLIINEFGYKKTEVGVNGQHFFTVYPHKTLMRQDVVVFRFPKNPSKFYIKRIIGLPGEKVEMKNNHVYIYNNSYPAGMMLIEDNYLPAGTINDPKAFSGIELGSDEYFVLGDNREESSDSRFWGPVKSDLITGRVLLRAWPFSKADIY